MSIEHNVHTFALHSFESLIAIAIFSRCYQHVRNYYVEAELELSESSEEVFGQTHTKTATRLSAYCFIASCVYFFGVYRFVGFVHGLQNSLILL